MDKEQILITGSDGMVGSYVDFGMRMSKDEFDVTNLALVMDWCFKKRPRVILHLAALTDLSLCEREPSKAYLVNSVGTYNLALAAREIGAKLVYVSTSAVFDGEKEDSYAEKDVPRPVNVYGHSKYLAELITASMLENYLIVRTSWVFGGGELRDKKFVGKMIALRDAEEVRVVDDTYGSPTYAKDLIAKILELLQEEKRGIIHIGGEGATRYDVACEIFSILGSKTKLIPVASSDISSAYKSGKNESMQISHQLRPWKDGLREYVHEEWNGHILQSNIRKKSSLKQGN